MLKTDWQKVKLGEVISVLTDYHANGSYKKLKENVTLLDEPDYAIMIRTTNFEKNDFSTDIKFIDKHAYDFLSKSKVIPGDILMNKIANPGSVYLMPNLKHPVSLAMNLFLIRMNNKFTVQRYVYYYLKENEAYIKTFAVGTAAKTITKDAVRGLEIILPPVPTQHKIASLLSAYDELIENNTKRIKILEEMAQTIYNEWFVKFRFPGHENVKMVDSELGMIPEGWEVKELRDISTISRGKSYRSKDLVNEGGLPFINLKCIDRDGGFRYDGMKQYKGEYKESHILRTGDIVIAVTDMTQERRVVARSARIPVLKSNFGIISMDLVKIAANKLIPNDYLYGMLRYSDFADNVKQYANGTNVLHLNPEHILDFKVALAPHKLRENYSTICDYVYKELNILHLKSQNLRHTRDLLLPRLISGEIDVSELDINVEEITA